MSSSEWLVCTTADHAATMEGVVRAHDAGAHLRLVADGRALRNQLRLAPGVAGVAVGFVGGPVSDVNLAAAIASDGCAREVLLVRQRVSGSLKSRSRLAGIDMVVQAGGDCLQLSPLKESGGTADGDPRAIELGGTPQLPTAGDVLTFAPLDEPDVHGARHMMARVAPVITLCSGRGGVGRSTLTGLAAVIAASWGLRVVVVDLDLTSGNLRGMLGENASSYALAVEDGTLVPRVGDLLSATDAFASGPVVLGPCELPEQAEEVIPHVQSLIDGVAKACDLVLVDTPTTVTDAVAAAMQASERVLLVSDDQPGGLASLARVSGLAVRLGVARTRIMRVENRGDPHEDINLSLGRAEVGLEVARVLRVFEGGPDVVELSAAGKLAVAQKECRELSASVATLLAQVLSELGALPDVPAAKEALKGMAPKKRRLFGMRREAC